MSRTGFQKSVRMFHKFSEETLRRRGSTPGGQEGVLALAAIEGVLKGQALFEPALIEPLAAFTNLLQSSQLPPEFGDYSFADAVLAVEEAQAELRQSSEQIWEFSPELQEDVAAQLVERAPSVAQPNAGEHASKLRRFVLDSVQTTAPGSVLVVGALSAPELPLAELATRFERVTLNDLDIGGLEELVRRAVPEERRERVRLERYDATGSYAAFAEGVERAIASAAHGADAEQALLRILRSYDVGAGSAGLSFAQDKPDLAISAMLLSELGSGYPRIISTALAARGWDASCVAGPDLAPAISWLRCLVAQHHVQALLRRSQAAVLVSAVSRVELVSGAGRADQAKTQPLDLLSVERLVERLPSATQVKAEATWEWRQAPVSAAGGSKLLTLVEAVLT